MSSNGRGLTIWYLAIAEKDQEGAKDHELVEKVVNPLVTVQNKDRSIITNELEFRAQEREVQIK